VAVCVAVTSRYRIETDEGIRLPFGTEGFIEIVCRKLY